MTDTHYIRAGWLIDGTGSEVQRDVLITVSSGVIDAVGPFNQEGLPDSAVVKDLSFGTILPPLIDCHVHMAMSGSMDPRVRENQLTAGCDELDPVISHHTELLFTHGVLIVRDGGDRGNCVNGYLADRKEDDFPVRIMSPGKALYKEGRYGSLIGSFPGSGQSLVEAYNDVKGQANYIKLINSGLNSLARFGKETEPQFDVEEIKELVEAARQDGKKVMVHANGKKPVRQAIEAGCDSIEHGFFMGEENLELMLERGCVWVPTMCTMKAYAEILEYDRNYAGSEVATKNLQHQLKLVRRARALGVTVALGTDAGSPGVLHGESVFEEMKLFVKAGFPLVESVQSATSIGAKLLGLSGTCTIIPGQAADFIVARGAPGQLPRKLSYLEGIYIGGNPSAQYRKNPYKHVQKTT